MIWLWASAGVMVLTALTHCVVGEKRLITPLLKIEHPFPQAFLARQLIRFAWHLTGGLMPVSAAVMVWPQSPKGLVVFNAVIWLLAGLIDVVITKGQHTGWPLLTIAGTLGLLGVFLS